MNRKNGFGVAFSVAVISVSAGTAAAFVPWSNPNGVAATFTWSGGGSDTGLFGSPILIGNNTFLFTPSGFRADAGPGQADIAYDRLQFDLHGIGNFRFTNIQILEFGDYGIFNGGQVAATMALFVADLDNGAIKGEVGVMNPVMPIISAGFDAGLWDGDASADLTTGGFQGANIRIVLNNNLIAISGPHGVTFIEKKFTEGIIIKIPSSGSLALLGLGGLVAARRRR